MDVLSINIPASPLQVFQQDIITHLAQLKDQTGQQIFTNVFSDWGDNRITATEQDSPYCLVRFTDGNRNEFASVQFFNLKLFATCEIYIYGYQSNQTLNDAGEAFSWKMQDLMIWVSQSFFTPEIAVNPPNSPGFAMKKSWRNFVSPQFISIGNAVPTDSRGNSYTMDNGWICKCMKAEVWTMNQVKTPLNTVTT